MDLTRRGFLLGATKIGTLALLPVPLLLPSPETEVLVEPTLSGFTTDMNMINIGGIFRSKASNCADGIYFNKKLIPARNMTLSRVNAYDSIKFDIRENYRYFHITPSPDIELSVEDIYSWEDPYEVFLKRETVKADIAFGQVRYRGNFFIESFKLSSPSH